MGIRRFTRLTNGVQQEVGESQASLCLWCRLLQLLQNSQHQFAVTAAMEAGITDHVWDLGELPA